MRVRAPIGPGLVVDVDIAETEDLLPGRTVEATARSGVVAIDGERAFRIDPRDPVSVTLDLSGPLAIDVAETMRHASGSGHLVRHPATAGREDHPESATVKGDNP